MNDIKVYAIENYPLGWEWIKNVPLEDWDWLIDVFATLLDDVGIYESVEYDNSSNNKKILSIDREDIAYLLNEDQGYLGGISEYGSYIAAKFLQIKSEEEYLEKLNEINQYNLYRNIES